MPNRAPRIRNFALALTMLTSLSSLATGCIHFDNLDEPLQLQTHAGDWRDEVIYQILIDRFADGDEGNNYRHDPNSMAHYHGGDWQGLIDRLDYIESLGATALWISPVVKNVDTDAGVDGYHGYWAQDLSSPNPHFGDISKLRELVAAAHDRGMLVIIDIVTNHMGQAFYYDINLNGQPDIRLEESGWPGKEDVIHITEYDPDFDPRGIQAFTSLGEAGPAPIIFQFDPATNHMPPLPILFQDPAVYNKKGRTFDFSVEDQLIHGDFPGGLKDVDTTNCDVKHEMVNQYARWIELSDADGFRIDTVKHVEREFWRFFAQRVRQRLAAQGKENFFMFGEAFDGNDELVGSFTRNDYPDNPSEEQLMRESSCASREGGPELTGDQLDSAFYFPQHYQGFRDIFQSAGPTQNLANLWALKTQNYGTEPAPGGVGVPPYKALVNFIDNHDVARFLWGVADKPADVQRKLLHNALVLLMTADGIPCLYYGTEQDFNGGNDPANREDMWMTGYATEGATFKWTQKLIELRKSRIALRRGDTNVVWSTEHTGDESDAGIFAFERLGGDAGDDYALIILNTNQDHDSSTLYSDMDGESIMQTSLPEGTVLNDILNPGVGPFTVGPNGELGLTLPPMFGSILVAG